MLREYCFTSADVPDYFVGIRFKEGIPEVVFPHGYHIAEDDKGCRKDIFKLMAVLKKFTEHNEGEDTKGREDKIFSLPITSYQYIIQDYLAHGYYTEREVKYVKSQRGKINWKRTIQQEQAQIDNDNVVYLSFQTKTNRINDNNLLCQIHHYCVYVSFMKFGWLYFTSDYLPEKPEIPFNKKLFVNALTKALGETYNDQKRMLFQCMLNVVCEEDEESTLNNVAVGVNRFDPIWERLVDYVFGEDDKEKYFPHATWHIIKNGKVEQNSALEPDTIMKWDNKIFVLDAKYYQYGVSGTIGDLPATTSIQKQITYGKHIAEQIKEVEEDKVFNAFIMPYDSTDSEKYKFVSVATADWETYDETTKNYAYVLGMLLDTKWLMSNYVRRNTTEIEILADEIESSLSWFRDLKK